MKTIPFSLNGTEYKLCFSLGLLMEVTEEHGSIYNLIQELDSGDLSAQMDAVFNIAAKLIREGAAFTEKRYHGVGSVISAAELRENCDAIDYYDLRHAVLLCFQKGAEPLVKLEVPENESKNSKASAELT